MQNTKFVPRNFQNTKRQRKKNVRSLNVLEIQGDRTRKQCLEVFGTQEDNTKKNLVMKSLKQGKIKQGTSAQNFLELEDYTKTYVKKFVNHKKQNKSMCLEAPGTHDNNAKISCQEVIKTRENSTRNQCL